MSNEENVKNKSYDELDVISSYYDEALDKMSSKDVQSDINDQNELNSDNESLKDKLRNLFENEVEKERIS